jgi:hypothetical protein
MHSHERRVPGSMIDDEFEVCFKLLLSVMITKRRVHVDSAGSGLPTGPISRGRNKKRILVTLYCQENTAVQWYCRDDNKRVTEHC